MTKGRRASEVSDFPNDSFFDLSSAALAGAGGVIFSSVIG